MDESGDGFVHGRNKRCRCLETPAYHRHLRGAGFRRFSGARLYLLPLNRNRHRGTDHERTEVGNQSATTKTRDVGSHGATRKGASRVYVGFQEAGGAPIR